MVFWKLALKLKIINNGIKMINAQDLEDAVHRISLFSGMLIEYPEKNRTEQENRYRNIVIDKMIKEIAILNLILKNAE